MSPQTAASKLSNTAQILGSRVSFWIGLAYPGTSRNKRVARDFGVSEGTAKRWRGGECPTQEYLGQMARKWGWRFVQFIHQPLIEPSCDEIDARLYAARDLANAGMAEAREGL